MEKRYVVFVLAFALLALAIVSGCGKSADDINSATSSNVQANNNNNNDNGNSLSQNLVNFKCVWTSSASKGQVMYVLKDKIMVVGTDGKKVWLDKDYAYIETDLDGKNYLLKMPVSNSGFSYDDMININKGSALSKYVDCKIGVVAEDDIKKPDYEVITMEEMMNMKMKEMMNK